MTAKRVAKSAVEWAAFFERVPPNQRDAFRAFKSKSDLFVSKVHRFPENLPQIDFASYAGKLNNPAMLAEFEKSYKALSISYPKDKANVKAQIDADEKATAVATQKHVAELRKIITDAKTMLSKIDSVPAPNVMTNEMYADYFPDQALNPWERPTFWPHTKSYQPENDHHTIH
uniref:ATP synthase subunit d, mitochondrial n=1 Tax=Mesenchytraeus cf. pedatus SL-2017 TaxID=2052678 RepID=A0A286Q4W2_9ANNE|nr:mitochondrial ATP synthase subunit d precursor [Mesenchytraeus cf. pedatus SL-2017]